MSNFLGIGYLDRTDFYNVTSPKSLPGCSNIAGHNNVIPPGSIGLILSKSAI